MGVAIGAIGGVLAVLMLLVPFIIDIYLSGKQSDTGNKRALEAAAILIAIAGIFLIGALIFTVIISSWSVGKTAASQLVTGFEGTTVPEGTNIERGRMEESYRPSFQSNEESYRPSFQSNEGEGSLFGEGEGSLFEGNEGFE